jgi:hypothetical protein
MMAPSTVIAPEALQMQLDLLRLAFPRWEINCCGYDRDSWFGDCRCMLVAGSAARMLELLNAEEPLEDVARAAPSGLLFPPIFSAKAGSRGQYSLASALPTERLRQYAISACS